MEGQAVSMGTKHRWDCSYDTSRRHELLVSGKSEVNPCRSIRKPSSALVPEVGQPLRVEEGHGGLGSLADGDIAHGATCKRSLTRYACEGATRCPLVTHPAKRIARASRMAARSEAADP